MRTHRNGVQTAQNQGHRLISVLFWFLYSWAVKQITVTEIWWSLEGLSVSRVIWIYTMSLNQPRNQSNGHYQPSHTEAPLFCYSPAFGQVFEVLSQLGPWLTLRTGLIFPQWALLWCVSPWRAWCWIPAHGWKSEREERRKEVIHVTTELTSAVCQLLELIWKATIIKDTVVKGCKIGFLQAKTHWLHFSD